MKKTLLLLASLLMTMGTFADEVTFDFVKNGLSMFPGITAGSTQDGQDASTLTHDGDITENKTATIDGVTLTVGTSCGSAVYPDESRSTEEIRVLADQRMYEDKEKNHAGR